MMFSLNGRWNEQARFSCSTSGCSFYPALSAAGKFTILIGRATWIYAAPSSEHQEWLPSCAAGFERPVQGATPHWTGASMECPSRHRLRQFTTVDDDWSCSFCSRDFPEGTTLHGCRVCDYDLCPACLQDFEVCLSQSSRVRASGDSIAAFSGRRVRP